MKIRRFYPSQVIRRLSGKRLGDIDAASRHALNIGLCRSRKLGVAITVVDGLIDVRNAADLGRLILSDLRATVQKMRPTGVIGLALPVLVHDEL